MKEIPTGNKILAGLLLSVGVIFLVYMTQNRTILEDGVEFYLSIKFIFQFIAGFGLVIGSIFALFSKPEDKN